MRRHRQVGLSIAPLATAALLGCGKPDPPGSGPTAAPAPAPCFTEITDAAKLDFRHDPGIDDSFFMPQIMGSGAALFDCDGDGDLDVYLVNGARRDDATAPPLANRLYTAEPDGTFRDRTAESGLGDTGFGMGVAVGDYDNDGHPDVYLLNYGPDALYRNDGDGTFTDVTAAAGIDNPAWACSGAFVDFDLDGHLDIYAANYVDYPRLKVCSDDAGRPEYCGPQSSPPVPDVLFRNDGDGTFTDVSAASGIASAAGRGLGVLCADLDGDDRPDIYVANDGEPNQLWMNDGDGTFTESAMMAGAALNAFANTEASMGVTAGDIDDDGDLDLFMTHLVRESNTLYLNDGAGNFDDATAAAGLSAASMPFTGFGTAFFDYDNDGTLDLAVVNGRVKRGSRVADGADPADRLAAYAEPNLLFENTGGGRFVETSDRAGALTRLVETSRGLAVGDLDGDGGLDVLVSNCDGPARLYRNTVTDRGHWLIVRAYDETRRRDAYGARITVTAGGRTLHRLVNPGYSYGSSGDPRAHFGLGDATRVDAIEIRWPGGRVTRHAGVAADQAVTLGPGPDATVGSRR